MSLFFAASVEKKVTVFQKNGTKHVRALRRCVRHYVKSLLWDLFLGFFGMWNFGRSSKQTSPQSKKVPEIPNLRTLELTGDLIGHSGAVQV